jgi:hypothetical protein
MAYVASEGSHSGHPAPYPATKAEQYMYTQPLIFGPQEKQALSSVGVASSRVGHKW